MNAIWPSASCRLSQERKAAYSPRETIAFVLFVGTSFYSSKISYSGRKYVCSMERNIRECWHMGKQKVRNPKQSKQHRLEILFTVMFAVAGLC